MPRLDISLTERERDEFLEQQRVARVATADAEGRPQVVPLWFVWVGGALYANTSRGNLTVRNLEANPHAAATVDDGETYADLRGVILRGPMAEVGAADERFEEVRAAFSRKYYGGSPPPFDQWRNRFFLRLEPEDIASWDFRKIPAARAARDENAAAARGEAAGAGR